MRPRKAPQQSRRRGQALVELCLAMPILLVIFLAVLEVTRLIEVYTTITRAATDTAILWARRDNQSRTLKDIKKIVAETLEVNGVDASTIQVTASTQTDPKDATLEQRIVTIFFTVQPIAPVEFFGYQILDPSLQVSAQGVACSET